MAPGWQQNYVDYKDFTYEDLIKALEDLFSEGKIQSDESCEIEVFEDGKYKLKPTTRRARRT